MQLPTHRRALDLVDLSFPVGTSALEPCESRVALAAGGVNGGDEQHVLGRIALQKCGECRVRLGAPTKVALDNGKASEPKRIVGLARHFGERRIRLSAGEEARG